MAYLPDFRLRLYRNFKAVEAADFHGLIRFYERHENAIATLDREAYFDCTLAYTDALFETQNFRQHQVMCDHLIEQVIHQNMETWAGEDIYARLLFRKASAFYHLADYAAGEHILRELLKLYPRQKKYTDLLRRCLYRQRPAWLRTVRTATIALVFLAVSVIALELIVVRPYFNTYYRAALVLHNLLLICSLLVFAGGEYRHFLLCARNTRSFAQKAASAKKA